MEPFDPEVTRVVFVTADLDEEPEKDDPLEE